MDPLPLASDPARLTNEGCFCLQPAGLGQPPRAEIAPGFLVGGKDQDHVSLRSAGSDQGACGIDHRRHRGLHVARSQANQPAVAQHRVKWIGVP